MKQQEQQDYTVLKPFPWPGQALRVGDTVRMHPKQAKYYNGTHLRPADQKAAPRKRSRKNSEVTDNG